MTKEEYMDFLNLQGEFEFLQVNSERKMEKLRSFKTDDKEFDEFLEMAVRFYFKTKIDEAWKKIEEFKTAPEKVKINIGGSMFDFKVADIQEAKRVCESGPCCHRFCPLKTWASCRQIIDAYDRGNYKEV